MVTYCCFLNEYHHYPGLVTSGVFSKEMWENIAAQTLFCLHGLISNSTPIFVYIYAIVDKICSCKYFFILEGISQPQLRKPQDTEALDLMTLALIMSFLALSLLPTFSVCLQPSIPNKKVKNS